MPHPAGARGNPAERPGVRGGGAGGGNLIQNRFPCFGKSFGRKPINNSERSDEGSEQRQKDRFPQGSNTLPTGFAISFLPFSPARASDLPRQILSVFRERFAGSPRDVAGSNCALIRAGDFLAFRFSL